MFSAAGTIFVKIQLVPVSCAGEPDEVLEEERPPSPTRAGVRATPSARVPVALPVPAAAPPPAVVEAAAPSREVRTDNVDFQFHWNSYSSSFSTDFTGYSELSKSLSDFRPSDDDWLKLHGDPDVGKPKYEGAKVYPSLRGKVVEGKRIVGEGEVYATAQLVKKSGKTKGVPLATPTVADTADPSFQFDFDLGKTKRGEKVQFIVWRHAESGGDQQVGIAETAIKLLRGCSKGTRKLKLTEPPVFEASAAKIRAWGRLSVEFDLNFPE
jgi:hypothetical protein